MMQKLNFIRKEKNTEFKKSKSKTVVARIARLLEDYGYHTHAERLSSEHNTE